MNKFFSLIFSGAIHQKGKQKVLPKEEFSLLMEAQEVLENAKKDVELYLEQNKQECAKVLKKAKEAGFDEGLREFNKHIMLYEEKIASMEQKLQTHILPLALQAAKKIVGREMTLNSQTIVDIVLQSLKPVTQNHFIKIYVNKKDKEILDEKKEDLKAILEHVKTFVIEERDDVEVGGCIIETEAGIINASLQNQWRALELAFEAFMKH